MANKLISSLRDALGPEGVLTGAAVTARRAGIWSEEPVRARAIFRPRTTAEVAAVLSACNRAGQSVVTHGGLTGLVQGSHTTPEDVVLSLERMNRVEAIDKVGRTMTVQAGANEADAIDIDLSANLTTDTDLAAAAAVDVEALAAGDIALFDTAIKTVSTVRAGLGASQNQLESAVTNLNNNITNLSDARSRIEDTDYSTETTALAKAQILSQASGAMLAQANQSQQNVLSLLR